MRLIDLTRTKKVILWLILWFSAGIVFLGAAVYADESTKEAQTEESKNNQFVTYQKNAVKPLALAMGI